MIVRLLPWLVLAFAFGLATAALILLAGSENGVGPDGPAAFVAETVSALAFPAVGAVVAWRRPGHPIGWLLLVTGCGFLVENLAGAYVAALPDPAQDRIALAFALAADSLWLPSVLAGFVLVTVLYPEGVVPSARWRPLLWLVVAAALISIPLTILSPDELYLLPGVANPWALPEAAGVISAILIGCVAVVLLALPPAAASIVLRFWGSRGLERQQMKWFAAAAVLVIVATIGAITLGQSELIQVAYALSIAAVPIAIGIAVLRYRLYDIDRIISRTVTYALVVGLLAAVYAGGVFLLADLLPFEGDVAVAASTLAAAALFGPVRRRVQAAVDRRFNRARYDAQRVVSGFAERLRSDVDLESVRGDLARVVDRTVQPASATVWLREAVR